MPDTLMYREIEDFGKSNISKTFGMSFNEYMDLPFHVARRVREVALSIARDQNKTANDILDDIE